MRACVRACGVLSEGAIQSHTFPGWRLTPLYASHTHACARTAGAESQAWTLEGRKMLWKLHLERAWLDAVTHARTHARTRARAHTHTHTCMHACMHTHTCMHACMHARTHTYGTRTLLPTLASFSPPCHALRSARAPLPRPPALSLSLTHTHTPDPISSAGLFHCPRAVGAGARKRPRGRSCQPLPLCGKFLLLLALGGRWVREGGREEGRVWFSAPCCGKAYLPSPLCALDSVPCYLRAWSPLLG